MNSCLRIFYGIELGRSSCVVSIRTIPIGLLFSTGHAGQTPIQESGNYMYTLLRVPEKPASLNLRKVAFPEGLILLTGKLSIPKCVDFRVDHEEAHWISHSTR